MEPDKKLLKKVEAEQAAIKKASKYNEEAKIHPDRSATSSDDQIKKLNK